MDMAPVALECPVAGCDLGEEGAKFTTPELEAEIAMRMLELHGQSHRRVPSVNATPVTTKNMWERQKKFSASIEMTEVKWQDYPNQRARYKRSSGASGQDIVDDLVLCLSDELMLEVICELGDSLKAITEEELVEAIYGRLYG